MSNRQRSGCNEGKMSNESVSAALLERAVALLEDVPCKSDTSFWRDYLVYSGKHMICTDEGWESGEAKASYEEMAKEQGLPLSDFILDEVNAPAMAIVV